MRASSCRPSSDPTAGHRGRSRRPPCDRPPRPPRPGLRPARHPAKRRPTSRSDPGGVSTGRRRGLARTSRYGRCPKTRPPLHPFRVLLSATWSGLRLYAPTRARAERAVAGVRRGAGWIDSGSHAKSHPPGTAALRLRQLHGAWHRRAHPCAFRHHPGRRDRRGDGVLCHPPVQRRLPGRGLLPGPLAGPAQLAGRRPDRQRLGLIRLPGDHARGHAGWHLRGRHPHRHRQ